MSVSVPVTICYVMTLGPYFIVGPRLASSLVCMAGLLVILGPEFGFVVMVPPPSYSKAFVWTAGVEAGAEGLR